jgi:hypothetical protein
VRIQCTACISIGLLILLVSFGCDSDLLPDGAEDFFPGSRRSRENLKTLGKIYHAYHDANRTGPDSWTTTEEFCQQYEAWQEVLQELRTDGVVVHWGISFVQAKVGTSNYVLAYEKSTPKSGGWVLRLDGSVVKYDPQMLQDGLQNQAQVDQEVFGRSPPVPVEFSPEVVRGTGAESQGESIGEAKPDSPQLPPALGRKPSASDAPGPSAHAVNSVDASPPPSSWPRHSASAPPPSSSSPPRSTSPLPPLPSSPPRSTPPFNQPPRFPQMSRGRTNGLSSDSRLVGGTGGVPFRAVTPDRQPVVGIRYRLGSWAGQESVGKIEGVSQRTKTPGPWEHVFAREGYALGAIQVDADKFVHAVRLAFMRIDGDRLDAKDSYVSEWIGSPSGAQPETINGNGAPVIGFHGRAMAIVDAVGLVFTKD